MSRIALNANASGSGVFTIESPNSDTDRTLNLPDKSGTVQVGSGIDDNADATAITIDSSEKVGIGTSSPNQLLTLGSATGSATIGLDWETSTTVRGSILYNAGAGEMAFTSGYSGYGGYMTFDCNGAERMRILSSGGVTFNGDTAAANALDDYEEGTYDPVYFGSSSAGSTTYGRQNGVYTKIGRAVTVWVDMDIQAQSGASGVPQISLPFTSGTGYGTDAQGATIHDMGCFVNWQTGDNFTGTRLGTGWVTNSHSSMQMYAYTTNGAGGLTSWSLNQTGRISGKIFYTAAF